MGPALPMGDDFDGLVYLHGSLRQESRRLVVTDSDFGRAYLRDAWATRFLERMFATYTVLFVGYSHGDVVMRYLARALGPGAPRYVLTSSPDAPDWRQLGIHPVGYDVVEGSHAALVDAVQGWASWASMGLLGHRQRVAQLVSAPPSQVPEEASYLETLLADGEKVRLFVELARGEQWLSWAAVQPEFRRLFDPTAAPTDCTRPLAYWFAEHFVMKQGLTEAALAVVRDAGGRLGLSMWSAIGHHLHMRKEPRPEWLGPWLVLLVQSAPDTRQSRQDWLDYALGASQWPANRVESLLLLDHLTEPEVAFRPPLGLDRAPSFDVELRGAEPSLREAWQTLFVPNLAEAARAVLAIMDRHLRRAHQLLTTAGSAGPGWDPVSFSRSAIEPHPQDRNEKPVDVLIDAARDCLEVLLNVEDDLGVGYLNAWADSEVPILRRLAVHGWVHRGDADATSKIRWLRDRGWLFDHQLRHEVFRLIEAALPAADHDVADALVADAETGPDGVADDSHSYERFNALAWITRHAPDLRSGREAFQRLQADYPGFSERPHPDLNSWFEVGTVGAQPPMAWQELHERIVTDADAAITELRRYQDVSFPFDGPTWQDALAVLVDAVRNHPADGFIVLDERSADSPDITRAVIRGWATAGLDEQTAEAILERFTHMDLATVADDVAQMLSDGGRSEANPTEWHRLPAARQCAIDVWATLDANPPDPDVQDWLTRAINRPAGRLALFWVNVIAADWRADGDNWTGLPSPVRAVLEGFLDSEDDRTAMAEVVLASQVLFFFAADRTWCETQILPLLDWTDPVRARRTWQGFLVRGRWNDQLLTAGLLQRYEAAAGHIQELREESRRQLCVHLAGVALRSEIDPLTWVRSFTVAVDAGYRVEWMNQVAWMLDGLPAEAVEHQWQRWMRQYWSDRLDSIPLKMSTEEASAMAAWVVHLTESIEDGAELATAHPASLGPYSGPLHDLKDSQLDMAPASYAQLLAHLLRGTQPPFWGCHDLSRIVSRLRQQPEPPDINGIIEEAMRLGCSDAPSW